MLMKNIDPEIYIKQQRRPIQKGEDDNISSKLFAVFSRTSLCVWEVKRMTITRIKKKNRNKLLN
jgi:hypothetical protein